MDELSFVVVSDDEADLLAEAELSGLTPAAGAGEITDLAVDPLTAALVVGGALVVGRFVVGVIDRWRGGVLIDRTQDPARVSRTRDLPQGYVVILAPEGTSIEVKDEPKDAIERIAVAVLALPVTATVDAIKAAIAAAKAGGGQPQSA